MKLSLCAALVLVPLAMASCASTKIEPAVYMHPNADLSVYERVAVLPFENLTTERFAADRVRELLVVELSSKGLFEVVESGEVNRVLRTKSLVGASEVGPELIQQLGKELNVQALLTGSVIEYREQRTGNLNTPDIALSLKLLDVETGLVIWSVTDARTGLGVWTRLFGVGEEDQTTEARKLIRDLLTTLG